MMINLVFNLRVFWAKLICCGSFQFIGERNFAQKIVKDLPQDLPECAAPGSVLFWKCLILEVSHYGKVSIPESVFPPKNIREDCIYFRKLQDKNPRRISLLLGQKV